MTRTTHHSTSVCADAAMRLSSVIHCSSIMEYALTVTNPSELEALSKLVTSIGLHSECSKSDLCQCIDFIDGLQDKPIYNNQVPPRKTPSVRRTSTRSALPVATNNDAKPREIMTFRSRGIHDQCIKLLYQQMVKDGWIEGRTKESDFLELFSGERSEGIVYWAGKYGKGTLVFLFRYMLEERLIEIDNGFTLPKILMGHFADTQGHFLTNLDNGDPASNKAGKEIIDFINILKYNPARAIRNSHTDDDDFSPGYGDTYDPYDHQDLHLHNKKGF